MPKTKSQNQSPNRNEVNLFKQIKQYSLNLQEIITKLLGLCNYCRSIGSQMSVEQIQIMVCRLQLQISKYKGIIVKIEDRVMSKGGVQSLRCCLSNSYNLLIKQSHQLISMCGNQIKQPTTSDFHKIKTYEEELDDEWDSIQESNNGKKHKNITIHKEFDKTLLNKNNLLQMAASQIQQQFLAIRMIAYKMYENYNVHEHPKLKQEMDLLREEQEKLSKEISEMKKIKVGLIDEQLRLEAQLTQIKKINELIGRRFFIEESRLQTNFTTN